MHQRAAAMIERALARHTDHHSVQDATAGQRAYVQVVAPPAIIARPQQVDPHHIVDRRQAVFFTQSSDPAELVEREPLAKKGPGHKELAGGRRKAGQQAWIISRTPPGCTLRQQANEWRAGSVPSRRYSLRAVNWTGTSCRGPYTDRGSLATTAGICQGCDVTRLRLPAEIIGCAVRLCCLFR